MSGRCIFTLTTVATLIALSGCGGSSGSSGSSGAHSSSATSPRAGTAVSGATTATSPRRSTHGTAAASATTPATTPTTSPHTLTAPPPTPSGTPAAPDGLRQTTGYATYELCATGCSGAVAPSLRRALHLPGPAAGGSCPLTAGSGPVKPAGSPTQLTLTPFIGSAWQGARVTWTSSGYQGPILIRGRELGGIHAVGFGEGHTPYAELQLDGRANGAPAGQWPSFTRVRGPGCYAYQIDGTSFSEVIVFRASG